MAKTTVSFVCNACGASHFRWAGRCGTCGAWNTLEESAQIATPKRGISSVKTSAGSAALTPTPVSELKSRSVNRVQLGSAELNRVLGGGIVPGSVILLGGEPGIGKSTLLLQVSGEVADGPSGRSVLYVSGEESTEQIGLRAERLGISAESLLLLPATDTDAIIQTIIASQPGLVIIDSIQTMATDQFSSGPGSLTQVRESAARLQTVAKSTGVPIVLVGHVTKDGHVAGPKLLEHLVDAVLYLEGEKWHGHRLVRGVKNRFGATDEVGVLEMTERGLQDVTDPAGVFLSETSAGTAGTAITATLEGTRSLLVEVQALAVETSFGYPKRTAAGTDLNKLQLLIAVLTKQAGLKLASSDVYVNVSGGYKLGEPAGDLAVALAVAGAVRNQALAAGTVVLGEVGLSGELRPVTGIAKRLEEAKRSGMRQAIIPRRGQPAKLPRGLAVTAVSTLSEAVACLEPAKVAQPASKGINYSANPSNSKSRPQEVHAN